MNIKKKFLLIGLLATAFVANNYVLSMEEVPLIPNSSYYVFDGFEGMDAGDCTAKIPETSKYVTFYTFDGTEIRKVDRNSHSQEYMEIMLDPSAPKPQPTSCLIKYRPGEKLDYYWMCCMEKMPAACFISFYDKNGNQIKSYPCCTPRQEALPYPTGRHIIVFIPSGDRGEANWYPLDGSNLPVDKRFPLDLSKISTKILLQL